MTGPRLKRHNFGNNHAYTIDCDCGRYRKGDRHKAVGVTTASGYAKDADILINWSSRVTSEYAVNNWAKLAQLPPADRLSEIGSARWNVNREAKVRGTRIHALGDKVAHGVEVEVPEELRGPVEAYARFLDQWDFQAWATETPCAHAQHGYAGTADAFGVLGKTGQRVLLDLKSGKGVYADAALQLAGYRYAEIWQPNGPESEEPLPEVDAVYVAHIMPDAVRLLPVEVDQAQWRHFLYTVQVARWVTESKEISPIGEAVFPEEFANV